MKTIELIAGLVEHIKIHGDTLVFLGAEDDKVYPREVKLECLPRDGGGCILVIR